MDQIFDIKMNIVAVKYEMGIHFIEFLGFVAFFMVRTFVILFPFFYL